MSEYIYTTETVIMIIGNLKISKHYTNPVMTIYTWAKAQAKNIERWMHGNGHVQIEQRGAGDNTPHRL
jgi:hypothetical protein